jgi:hypothetical protein
MANLQSLMLKQTAAAQLGKGGAGGRGVRPPWAAKGNISNKKILSYKNYITNTNERKLNKCDFLKFVLFLRGGGAGGLMLLLASGVKKEKLFHWQRSHAGYSMYYISEKGRTYLV